MGPDSPDLDKIRQIALEPQLVSARDAKTKKRVDGEGACMR